MGVSEVTFISQGYVLYRILKCRKLVSFGNSFFSSVIKVRLTMI